MISKIKLGMIVAVVLGLLVAAPPALAHAVLVRSEPPADSAQKVPPKIVRAWFSEAVEPSFSSLTVLDKAGTRVDKGDSQRMSDDATGLQVSLNDLSDGLYTVVWKTESAVDGHVVSGSFAFAVGTVPLTQASPRELMALVDTALSANAPPPLSQVIVRWLNILLLALLVGALVFPPLVLFPVLEKARVSSVAWLPRWLAFARGVFLLFAAATLAMVLSQAAAVGSDVGTIVRVITVTRFGTVWLVRVTILVALGYLLFRQRLYSDLPESRAGSLERSEPGKPSAWRAERITIVLGLLLLITQSLNSHDAAVASPPILPFLTDLVHLAGTAVWVGGLVQLLVLLPVTSNALDSAQRPRLVAHVIARFSLVAFITVGVILLTGAYSMVLQVGSLEALFATLYGTTLLVKFILIFTVLGVAGLNLVVTRPMAAKAPSERIPRLLRRFSLAVALEVILAVGILLAVGVMTSVAPAKTAYNPSPSFWMATQRVADLQVTLGVAPALVGTNDFDIKVRDDAGQPVSNANDVRILSTMREMDMGTQEAAATNQGDGHYTLHSDVMSMVGTWNLEVLVRRAGVDDARTTFALLALGQRLPPPTPVIAASPEAQAGLGLTLLAFAMGTASVLLLKRRRDRWVSLSGALAIALIGAFVVYQVSANAPSGTAFVVPVVPELDRIAHGPIAPTANQIAAGQQVFQDNCTVCHGVDGKGDGPAAAALIPKPADLTVHVPLHTDGELYWWITHGITTTAMPAWDTRLSDIQRWQVVQFLRQTFGTRVTPTPPAANVSPSLVFFAHPAPDVNVALTIVGQTFDARLTAANGQPAANIRDVAFQFTWLDQSGDARSVDVAVGDQGHYRTTGDYLAQPGMWLVELTIRRSNGPDLVARFPFEQASNAVRSTTNNANALAVLQQSDAQMNTLQTARATQELNDGAHAVVTTEFEYQAPDRVHLQVSGSDSIAIGGTQYDLENGVWSSRPRVDPFVFPSFDNAKQATGAKLGRTDSLNGVPTQVVEFTVPTGDSQIDYAYWIGTQDHLIHQYAMVALAHFMMQYYRDYNAPLDVQTPSITPGAK